MWEKLRKFWDNVLFFYFGIFLCSSGSARCHILVAFHIWCPIQQQTSLKFADGYRSLHIESQSPWASEMIPWYGQTTKCRLPVSVCLTKFSWVTAGTLSRFQSLWISEMVPWLDGSLCIDFQSLWASQGLPDDCGSLGVDSQVLQTQRWFPDVKRF